MRHQYETWKNFNQTGGLYYGYMPSNIVIAKSGRFDSKAFSHKPKYQTWNCSCCDKPILDDINQRGMKRTKCDECKKETDRLINTIRYWEEKVGVRILPC